MGTPDCGWGCRTRGRLSDWQAGRTGAARLRVGPYQAELSREGFAWTRRTTAADLFKPGDLIEVQISKVDEATHTATVTLEQTPLAEAAIVAIDNRSGQIKAMVGGWSFNRSKFNRAVQAYRQLGSTFKPIVYTAAIDRGYTPSSILIDSPVSYPAGNGQIYSPHDYDHKFEGEITLRHALEESRNIPAIRMMDVLGPRMCSRLQNDLVSRRTSRRTCRLRWARAMARCWK